MAEKRESRYMQYCAGVRANSFEHLCRGYFFMISCTTFSRQLMPKRGRCCTDEFKRSTSNCIKVSSHCKPWNCGSSAVLPSERLIKPIVANPSVARCSARGWRSSIRIFIVFSRDSLTRHWLRNSQGRLSQISCIRSFGAQS